MSESPIVSQAGSEVLISPPLSPEFQEQCRNLPPAKLGVLASGSGSNFEALIQAIADGELRAEIPVVIYNNPGAKVAARGGPVGAFRRCY